MVLPVVVIEVGPPEARPRYPTELSAACSDAVRRGRCVVTGQGPPEPHPAAVAIVSWGGRELSVRVQVGVRRAPGTRWLVRDMQFKDADAPVERWRAVGLTIATLVGELPSYPSAPAPTPAPAVTAAPPAVVARRPTPPRRRRRWWLEAGALLGPGLVSGAPRGGGYAGGAYLFGDLPLLAHVSLGYAARPADFRGLSVQFLTLQAGVGARLALEPPDSSSTAGSACRWSALPLPRRATGVLTVAAGFCRRGTWARTWPGRRAGSSASWLGPTPGPSRALRTSRSKAKAWEKCQAQGSSGVSACACACAEP